MNIMNIARICHEVNKAYCDATGDNSQPSWDDAPDWQKDSACNGVKYALANPDATPEKMHISWMLQKTQEGWIYGKVKDPAKKEHPCMVVYSELPAAQQVKDHLFQAVVKAATHGDK